MPYEFRIKNILPAQRDEFIIVSNIYADSNEYKDSYGRMRKRKVQIKPTRVNKKETNNKYDSMELMPYPEYLSSSSDYYVLEEKDVPFLTTEEKEQWDKIQEKNKNKEPVNADLPQVPDRIRRGRRRYQEENGREYIENAYTSLLYPFVETGKRSIKKTTPSTFITVNLNFRIIYKHEITNINAAIERFLSVNNITEIEKNKFRNAIYKSKFNKEIHNRIIFYNGYIEGIDFNVTESNDFEIIEFQNRKFVKHGEHYFTSGDSTAIILWENTKPISSEEFTKRMISNLSKGIDKRIKQREEEYENLMDKVMINQKSLGELKVSQNAIKKAGQTVVAKTIEEIKTIGDIETFGITGAGFRIITNDIYFTYSDDGKDYYCGKFEININILRNSGITIRNLAAPTTKKQHPHGACTGSFAHTIASALRELDYYTLVLTVLAMLKKSVYDPRSNFPLKKPKGKLHEFTKNLIIYGMKGRLDDEYDDINNEREDDDYDGEDDDDPEEDY